MKKLLFILYVLLGLSNICLYAQDKETQWAIDNYLRYYREAQAMKSPEKEKAIDAFRSSFRQSPFRYKVLNTPWSAQECLQQLDADGAFSGLKEKEEYLRKENAFKKNSFDLQEEAGNFLTDAFIMVWKIADAYRKGEISEEQALPDKVLKAILHYGNIEISRLNETRRFHASCFAMPIAAVNTYFCYLNQMDNAESGKGSVLLKEACDMLKIIGLQAWTQPLRHDETDKNVVSIPRFRNHVWWVGGNSIGYRPLFYVAFMYRSIPMIDLLAEISQKCISTTSQNTYDESFWTEGFTADGAGWGHGKQCLIWGYPIDGTANAIDLLSLLKGTPWEQKLSRENVSALLNYFRGGNFYYYKGYILPCLDRYSMQYKPLPTEIRYSGMLKQLIEDWSGSFTNEELKEIKQLYAESLKNVIQMAPYACYSGTRWFFNNDDLIKKNERYHIIVNMASVRCDGLESADGFADCFNFYTTDGTTMFQKTGNEYRKAFGAYDVTAFPGVTAREGMENLTPVTNWRGYCSMYNFAAGATSGGENAVAGYISEKMNAEDKTHTTNQTKRAGKNQILYGVKAYKSYFMLGDYMVALGAGITNKRPELAGNIRTTIEQTEHTDSVYLYKGKGTEWIVQEDKFAYSVFPEYKKQVHYTCETRATDWMKMNKSNKDTKDLPKEVDIFQIWIDHGKKPVNDTYGYVVYAGTGKPSGEYPFEVLRNDTLVQAVKSINNEIIEAVFYDAKTTLKGKGLSLSVSAPCVVLIEQQGNKKTISVTDARMDKECKEIDITLNGKKITCKMPEGELCGKSAILIL